MNCSIVGKPTRRNNHPTLTDLRRVLMKPVRRLLCNEQTKDTSQRLYIRQFF